MRKEQVIMQDPFFITCCLLQLARVRDIEWFALQNDCVLPRYIVNCIPAFLELRRQVYSI